MSAKGTAKDHTSQFCNILHTFPPQHTPEMAETHEQQTRQITMPGLVVSSYITDAKRNKMGYIK